jgi:N6-L-threonylcarbamoyladenine synthase
MPLCLAIDTSAYTTSVAVVDLAGELIAEQRRLLAVPGSQRGLRQSDAFFQHVKNLPDLLEQILGQVDRHQLTAVAASVSPRPTPDSYMPVFRAGLSVGRAIAATAGVSFLPFSHQEGHLWAAIWSCGLPNGQKRYLALHASGGTTDLLDVRQCDGRLHITRIGGDVDLHAGQFVDGVGVAMGMPFPAGPAIERLAEEGRPGVIRIPVAVRGREVSFSGPASAAMRALESGARHADLAWAVQECLAQSLATVVRNSLAETKPDCVLAVGGVMANRRVRETLAQSVAVCRVMFPPPEYSVDNAVGIAIAGAMSLSDKKSG